MTCVDLRAQARIERSDRACSRAERAGRTAQRARFVSIVLLVFIAGTGATIALCRSMEAMPSMAGFPMPGGWSVSTMWMPGSSCGQTWFGAAAAFVGMWTVMMVPMMLPSLAPALWAHWQSARASGHERAVLSTLCVCVSYFLFWSLIGAIAFAAGTAMTAGMLRSTLLARSMPVLSGIVTLLCGIVQFTAWKAHRLAGCRRLRPHRARRSALNTLATFDACAVFDESSAFDAFGALGTSRRFGTLAACGTGFRLSAESLGCCANLMTVLFTLGVMDPLAMAAVTVAMSAEQLTRARGLALKVTGTGAILAGIVMISVAVQRFAV